MQQRIRIRFVSNAINIFSLNSFIAPFKNISLPKIILYVYCVQYTMYNMQSFLNFLFNWKVALESPK